MAALKGSKTEENLKAAFAGESQANRRYLYFANTTMSKGGDSSTSQSKKPLNNSHIENVYLSHSIN